MVKYSFGLSAAGLLSVALLTGSCAKQEESLIVTRALVVESPCSISTGSNTSLARGFVDLSFDTAYWAAFELKNNLVSTASDKTSSGVNTSELYIDSVDVVLDTPQDSSIIAAVEAVDPALVDFNQIQASNSLQGQDILGTWVEIPEATFDALRNAMAAKYDDDVRLTLTMTVTFRAVRASNKGVNDFGEIEAREFTLPIEMCVNCLRDCSACGSGCDGDTTVGSGLCGSAQDGATVPASCVDTMDP